MIDLKKHIGAVPDFPKKGILFYDIGPLLAHGGAFQESIRQLADRVEDNKPDAIIGVESRGFLFGASLANHLGIGFIMARKKGKLPGAVVEHSYDLEYGQDTIAIQQGIIKPGQKLVLIDDLLATGGTAAATIALVRKVGGEISSAAFVIELSFLNGRDRLRAQGIQTHSLLSYSE